MKENRFSTVDQDTVASNPGNVIFMPSVWVKFHRKPLLKFAAIFLCILIFFSALSLNIGVAILFIASASTYFQFKRKSEHFALGDSNGGLVISENPKLVAVATDLSKGFGKYPVIKIISYNGKARLNAKIGTVALYNPSDDETPYWSDFMPIPIEYATNDQKEINNAMETYSFELWSTIIKRLEEIPKPYKEGLYRSEVEFSDWKETGEIKH